MPLDKASISKNDNLNVVFIILSMASIVGFIFSYAYFSPLDFYDPVIYAIPFSAILCFFAKKNRLNLNGRSPEYHKGIDKYLSHYHYSVKFFLFGIITVTVTGLIIFINGFFADPMIKKEYKAHVIDKHIEYSHRGGGKMHIIKIEFNFYNKQYIVGLKNSKLYYNKIKLGDTVMIEINRGYLHILFFGDWRLESNYSNFKTKLPTTANFP